MLFVQTKIIMSRIFKINIPQRIRLGSTSHQNPVVNENRNVKLDAGSSAEEHSSTSRFFEFHSPSIREEIIPNMLIYEEFISEEEENLLLKELEPYLKRLRYEYDHWDNAIHGYRETEKLNWKEENENILKKVKTIAFPTDAKPLQHIHVLDIAKEGYIKPHVDSIRFCGNVIAGLSLLSTCVMRLVHEKKPDLKVDILLPQRSLYIMKDAARFNYTHEILHEKESTHNGKKIPRERRISIMCRNEPDEEKLV